MRYKAPSYDKLRIVLVVKKTCLEKEMDPLKASCSIDGCSIVMDGWIDCWNHPSINIIVSSKFGPYFLKAIDCVCQKNNTMFLKNQLCDTIVEVGPFDAIQVVTNATIVCKTMRMMVLE